MSRTVSPAEVSQHSSANDCWIIINGKVYDVTSFMEKHPGGKKVIMKYAGKDGSKEFNLLHNESVMKQYGPQLYVGDLGDESSVQGTTPSPGPISAPVRTIVPIAAPVATPLYVAGEGESFGEGIPFGDPTWYQEWKSPYFNESHRKWRAACRDFVEREVMPFCHEWDEKKSVPRELWTKLADAGMLGAVVGVPWASEFVGDKIAGGVHPSEFDMFHELILIDEFSRCGSGGAVWAIFGGLSIGLPPVRTFGSKYLQDRVVRECLNGRKTICLAITEPYAGSDVANLQTTAKKTPDGKHYIVNGEKKWITNAIFADYFTVAVRTGEAGMGGVSLLLVERTTPGVTTRQMNCQGVWSSGTTYITFEDVKVPVENLIGKENSGFKYIMFNFNHERWAMCVQATRFARVCYEEAFRYAHKRKTFGKYLIQHPVIRLKLAHMLRQIEATWAWCETLTYQMAVMSKQEAAMRLGGAIALCKAQTSTVFEYCAREASQIFGGLSYTRGGQGEKVERLYRDVRAYAIPGGSEEILLDLGIRQAMRTYGKAKV
eukprot:TRINITY_DN444_c0_g3_i2.p1 TRINITY_DN444_c0_g3~~TRINITY_DN444_c0_g3_i2.p1  ORF type:complete len:545 (+),score=115.48 TRINITY_DN444_c0_g3_i2:132-1766(+)